jgi:MoaA/NifB/PqqE/SkfB family radical SAM enzyme
MTNPPAIPSNEAASPAVPRLRRPRFGRADARVLAGMAAGAVLEPHRPLLVHLVVTRRCNLACGYCTEYDHVSQPVPTPVLRERIDHLARLRTVVVTLTGGETLLHPDVAALVAHVRARGMTAAINTNGFLLTRDRIRSLNEAGLYALQISLDGVTPNAVTKKTLKPLLPKLRLLAEHAAFRVRVNTVLGVAPPDEAVEVARVALAHGFDAKCSLVRRHDGSLETIDDGARAAYDTIKKLEGRSLGLFGERFQDALVRDGRIDWKCRAGARFFHVCENGLVHLCGPRYGEPGTPLADYSRADIRRAFDTPKPCAATCPVAYAHQVSRIDRFRAQRAAGRFHAHSADGRRHLAVIR